MIALTVREVDLPKKQDFACKLNPIPGCLTFQVPTNDRMAPTNITWSSLSKIPQALNDVTLQNHLRDWAAWHMAQGIGRQLEVQQESNEWNLVISWTDSELWIQYDMRDPSDSTSRDSASDDFSVNELTSQVRTDLAPRSESTS